VSTYYMDEGAFDLPGIGFEDHTTHHLEATIPGQGTVGLVVYRARLPGGKSLRELVKDHTAEEGKRLSGYAVLEQQDAAWAEAPAIEVASRWRHEGKVIYQRKAHLAVGDTWMFFALSGPFEAREACDGWLAQIRTSIRLRTAD
jgi:hypothetical protein